MRLLGRAVAAFALLGAAAAWGQGQTSDSPTVSGGWQSLTSTSAVGGSYFSVKNRQSSTSETATWALQAPSTGDYQIQVYIPPADSSGPRTQNATYVINRGLGTALRDRVDQTLSGWQTIGTYKLAKGTIGITLTNRTSEPDGSHAVVADAVRLQTPGTTSGYSASLASSDLSRAATAGDVVTFDVVLTNTGSQTWYKDPAGKGQTPVRLALVQGPGPLCNNIPAWEPGFGWLPRSRDRVVMDTAQVAQGQTGAFLFSIQLAQNLPPGVYVYRFRPVAEASGTAGGEVMSPEIVISIGVAARPQNELDFSALQLYRANLSVHTSNSDGDKLIGKNFPDDRSPLGALTYARTQKLLNVLGLTDHGEELSAAEWTGQASATASQTTTTAGGPFFIGLRGFKWSATTGPHDFFGFPWEGSSTDLGHLSIFGTSTWTGTAPHLDGAPPQLTPSFIDAPNSDVTLSGGATNLADWLWVNGYPRPNNLDNGVSPAQFNHPSLFFRSNFFRQYQYEPDMDRFFPLMAVGTGEFAAGYATDPKIQPILASQISDKGGYRFLGPDDRPDDDNDTPNIPPKELRMLSADLEAAIGHPEDMTKWGTNPNNTNRYWFNTALHNGWHVGPTINGDNHAGCYCDDAGYTGIWAKNVAGQTPEQAQAAVLQALRERTVFASEDRGLSAQFSVFSNGLQYRMGQRNVPLSTSPRFRLDLTSVAVGGNPADVNVKAIYLVTNSGETQISGPRTGATTRVEVSVPVTITAADQELYFYARVVQNDNDQLLTAPIWMTSCCPAPTCSIFQTSGTAPAGACAIVGFTSQNGTAATLQIDGGAPFSVPLSGTRIIQTSEVSSATSVHTLLYRVMGACGASACSVQITCAATGGIIGAQCPTTPCTVTVSPPSGDSTTNFTASWTSNDFLENHLLVDGVDLGVVPAVGSRVLGQFSGCGTHTVALSRTCQGVPVAGCQTTFQVISNIQPGCRMSVLPPGGVQATTFDICFFASGATQVQVFVDGVLRCTQLNPVAGTQYNCLVSGLTLTPGFHTAMVVASDNCGGTCQRQMSFQVLPGSPITGK
jgi:hypothetical protein